MLSGLLFGFDPATALISLILIPISLMIFHICINHTKMQHEEAWNFAEGFPLVIGLILLIGITIYYA